MNKEIFLWFEFILNPLWRSEGEFAIISFLSEIYNVKNEPKTFKNLQLKEGVTNYLINHGTPKLSKSSLIDKDVETYEAQTFQSLVVSGVRHTSVSVSDRYDTHTTFYILNIIGVPVSVSVLVSILHRLRH